MSTPAPCVPSPSPASTAIPRLAGPPQVPSFTSARPLTGSVPQPQLQQHPAQLSQQQLQQLHAQQRKAYQQQLLEQQIFAQQNFRSQQMAFNVTPQDVSALSSTALPVCVPTSDVQSAQEMLKQQMLYQQMYEAALAQQNQQQQQHMKSTVSAGAINLIQHQASDGTVPPASGGSCEFLTAEADQMSAIRRASEGQVCVTASVASVDSASHSVTSAQSQSTDVIPTSSLTCTGDKSPSQCHDETFKVPFPPDHVRY